MLQKLITPILSGLCLLAAGQGSAADAHGPITYPGMPVLVNSNGVQAPSYQFLNECQHPGPWQAKWIWLGGESNAPAAMFRKEIVLPDQPRSAKAWLTADARYRLFINGQLVARGPVDMGRDYAGGNTHRWFYDFRDLQTYLRAGTNVIAAEVFRNWTGWTVSRGQPGFLFEAEIMAANGQPLRVTSDSSWHSAPAPQFPSLTVYAPGLEPAGWRLPGFAEAGWSLSRPVQDVWSPLVASEIPPLMEARYPVLRIEGLPARVITNDCSFRVVFDRVLSAYPTVQVSGGRGAELTVKANNEAKMILGGGGQYFEFPHLTEVAPAFTVTLKGVKEPVTIDDVGAIFTSQPVAYRGSFQCNDDQLNHLYDVSRWAVQICLQTHHLDSPNHQEPISDPGDYLIESMVNYQTFAQPWLARQDLRKFAWLLKDENYHNFHTSYSLGWLQMLLDYYDYTGDASLVQELSPYVHELLATYTSWRGPHGIISEAPNYMFMDWVEIGGFNCHHPPAVIGQGYLTALYYHGLDLATRVAALSGDAARVQQYQHLRAETARAFNQELWNPGPGLYRDGKPFSTSVKPGKWLPADTAIETFSPHVNLLAVLYDLAPQDRQKTIVEQVLANKPLNTQPWFMHWVFPAIDHAGVFERYAMAQLQRWQIVPETQSFREMWHNGDLSHGWCSTPLVQLSSKILGITPATPGFRVVAIRPQPCQLLWAKGAVPTPQGNVEVAWQMQPDKFAMDVVVPAGTAAEVTLPVERFAQAQTTCDGQPATAQWPVGAGKHHFEITGKLKPTAVVSSAEPAVATHVPDEDQDIVPDDLLHQLLASAADHATHPGGGSNAAAVFNGTTRNGAGGSETQDDGQTFRGYGSGDWLEFRLKQPANLTEVRSFANHADARSSQHYDLLVAHAGAPQQFVKVATGFKTSAGGLTELQLPLHATNVVAIRFEFRDGPLGFNVYREFNLRGVPRK